MELTYRGIFAISLKISWSLNSALGQRGRLQPTLRGYTQPTVGRILITRTWILYSVFGNCSITYILNISSHLFLCTHFKQHSSNKIKPRPLPKYQSPVVTVTLKFKKLLSISILHNAVKTLKENYIKKFRTMTISYQNRFHKALCNFNVHKVISSMLLILTESSICHCLSSL